MAQPGLGVGWVSTVCLFLQELLLARVALGRDPTTPAFHPLLGPAVHALGAGGALGQVGDSGTHLGGGWAITSAPLQRNGFTVAPKALPVSKGLSSCTLRKPRSGRARLAVISTGKPNAGGLQLSGFGRGSANHFLILFAAPTTPCKHRRRVQTVDVTECQETLGRA